jgi:hypothetical protein
MLHSQLYWYFFLRPNILLGTWFSNTLNLGSSLRVTDPRKQQVKVELADRRLEHRIPKWMTKFPQPSLPYILSWVQPAKSTPTSDFGGGGRGAVGTLMDWYLGVIIPIMGFIGLGNSAGSGLTLSRG